MSGRMARVLGAAVKQTCDEAETSRSTWRSDAGSTRLRAQLWIWHFRGRDHSLSATNRLTEEEWPAFRAWSVSHYQINDFFHIKPISLTAAGYGQEGRTLRSIQVRSICRSCQRAVHRPFSPSLLRATSAVSQSPRHCSLLQPTTTPFGTHSLLNRSTRSYPRPSLPTHLLQGMSYILVSAILF